MKNKFIRCVSPISLAVIALFDAASLTLIAIAVYSLTKAVNFYSVAFAVIMAVDLFAALLATKNLMKSGVLFSDTAVEFTGIDENNIFEYSQIISVETFKDSSASFKKNAVKRYSSIILFLNDNSVATIELGLTTRKKLKEIENELKSRI